MGTRKPNMASSIRRVRDVIMNNWDPIGIGSSPEAADEYNGYAASIYGILRQRRSEDALLDYLYWVTEYVGLPAPRDSLQPVVSKLLQIDLSLDEPYQ